MEDFLKNQLESLLFACGRKLSLGEMMKLSGITQPELIKEKLALLKQEYDVRNSAMMLVEETDGWKLTTREQYLPLVRKIVPHTELNKSVLETLAVIAWKQPIMQSEVIRIRTNKAYEHIGELETMGFVVKKKCGRTFSLALTQKFFDYFDLKDSAAVKTIFKDIKEELIKEGETPAAEVQPLPFESVPEPSAGVAETKEASKEYLQEDEKEETVYNAKDELLEEDEITPDEEKFMEGYEKADDEPAAEQEPTESSSAHAAEEKKKVKQHKSE